MSDDDTGTEDHTAAHAAWCAGGCPRWLATGAPTCLPYPCRCPDTRANAPEWARKDPKCWWTAKTGGLRSRCPCWGDIRDDKPDDCCSRHAANPAYLTDPETAFLTTLTDPDSEHAAAVLATVADPEDPEPAKAALREAAETLNLRDDERAWGDDPARERKPYVRRWPPEDLACEHDVSAIKGIHCQSCHHVYATDIAASMHRRLWTELCRQPQDIRDVDTGAELLVRNAEGAWAIDWAANR